jgi:hypothetical protein
MSNPVLPDPQALPRSTQLPLPTAMSRTLTFQPSKEDQKSPMHTLFPRLGHSVCAVGNENGDFLSFGGTVELRCTNDLFCISTRDQSIFPLRTHWDIPSPRSWHASALIGHMLIVWGGIMHGTDLDALKKQGKDKDLYILNLRMDFLITLTSLFSDS